MKRKGRPTNDERELERINTAIAKLTEERTALIVSNWLRKRRRARKGR